MSTDEDSTEPAVEVSLTPQGANARISHRALETIARAFRWIFPRKSARAAIEAAAGERLAKLVSGEETGARPIDAFMFDRMYGKDLERHGNAEAALVRTGQLLDDRYRLSEVRQLPAPVDEAPQNEPSPQDAQRPTSHEWFARWLRDVEDVTTESVRDLYARLLAGQIDSPGSFSMRTLTVLRDLDSETAAMFGRLRPYVFNQHSLPGWSAYSLEPALSWRSIDTLRLQDAGLISTTSATCSFPLDSGNESSKVEIDIDGRSFRFIVDHAKTRRLAGKKGDQIQIEAELGVAALTVAGEELMAIIQCPESARMAVAGWIRTSIVDTVQGEPASVDVFAADPDTGAFVPVAVGADAPSEGSSR